MMRRSNAVVSCSIATAMTSRLTVASLRAGQSPPDPPLVSEQYFKNIQVLKRMSVDTVQYVGFDTGQEQVPVEIYARAPNQRTWIVKLPERDSFRVFDGVNGWLAGPDIPVPIHAGNRQPGPRRRPICR